MKRERPILKTKKIFALLVQELDQSILSKYRPEVDRIALADKVRVEILLSTIRCSETRKKKIKGFNYNTQSLKVSQWLSCGLEFATRV